MRLKPRWHKVLRDLWGNKIRTTLVVLSIAIGVFAIGMIVGTQTLLREDLAVVWGGTNPANATLFTDPFDSDLLHSIERMDGVAAAEICPLNDNNEGIPSVWMLHLPVDDFAESLRLVREGGGEVVGEATGARHAVIRDPVGVYVALRLTSDAQRLHKP